MKDWDQITEALRARAQLMHESREAGLALTRQMIQTASKCIRHVHRHQFDEARVLLAKAHETSEKARAALRAHPELYYAGYLHDAEKEVVEAAAVISIVLETPLQKPEELGVGIMSYLNGMGEAASEVRRFAVDEMRAGRLDSATRILGNMEAIYYELITFDFPDSMTGGLRRTCDALRAVIERTRSDLHATASQHQLVEELRLTREALKG
ncbi:MAG: haloacid dehalogenase [Armatimonadetes bacterium]|nr:haloacid dehalogenase [Armatimonadota bacterium]